MQVRSKGIGEVLQFEATVWPKIASESTYEAQKFPNFLGEHPPDPLVYSAFRTASGLIKAGWGLGMRLVTNVVCPCCALTLAVFWMRHCGSPMPWVPPQAAEVPASFSSVG